MIIKTQALNANLFQDTKCGYVLFGRKRHSQTACSVTADIGRLTHCSCVISVRRFTISKRIQLLLN